MKALKVVLILVVAAGLMGMAEGQKEGQEKFSLPQDMERYEHIGTFVIPDEKSPITGFHHFSMNEAGIREFRKEGAKSYPQGTIIVGRVYEVMKEHGGFNEGSLKFFTVMRKHPGLSETRNTGGWLFAAFGTDGKKLDKQGEKDCFPCHKPFEKSDFVISRSIK
jgi:hypothetical protein